MDEPDVDGRGVKKSEAVNVDVDGPDVDERIVNEFDVDGSDMNGRDVKGIDDSSSVSLLPLVLGANGVEVRRPLGTYVSMFDKNSETQNVCIYQLVEQDSNLQLYDKVNGKLPSSSLSDPIIQVSSNKGVSVVLGGSAATA